MSVAETAPPPAARRWTKTRIAGWLLMAGWIAGGAALALYIFADWDQAFFARYAPRMLGGLGTTMLLVVVSISLGILLAQPIVYLRTTKNRILGAIGYAYVYFFRGTPILAQVFLVYYGAGQFRGALESIGLWWFFREAIYCALFTFTLNTAAYQAEIYRGAIQSVPKGQWEGARALGVPEHIIFLKIIVPQAAMIALRPLGNEIILMVKASAISSVITVFDLMGETRLAFSRSFDFTVYLWAAFIYLMIVEVLRRVWDIIEKRLTRHLIR